MDENTAKPSIIGRTYIPKDNSYSICLSKVNDNHGIPNHSHDYLAGTNTTPKIEAKECIIITEPFLITIHKRKNEIRAHRMIIVQYENKEYMVLYNKDGIK